MYSYEERIRAVELYIKLGKCVAATIRQLGYPTKNALKGWHREFELRQDLPVGYARSRPKYSPEQKKLAVDHYLDHGRCIALTIKTLGYPGRASLQAWIQELRPEAHSRVVGRSGRASAVLKRTAVIALCTREESAQAIADRLGVCRPTLYNWKHELLGIEVSASMKRKRESPAGPEREELERQLEALRREVRRLRLEQDLLTKANEILKKDTGIIQQSLTNREKTLLIDALRQTYSCRSCSRCLDCHAVPTSTIAHVWIPLTSMSRFVASSRTSLSATTVATAIVECKHCSAANACEFRRRLYSA